MPLLENTSSYTVSICSINYKLQHIYIYFFLAKSETKYNKQGIIARVKEMFNIKTKTKKSQK